jgi:SAM-dependent methyltransferase
VALVADERTRRIQQVWSEGDYAEVGRWFRPISERLVADLAPTGLRVLDAATGTGNTAIAAARSGADVDAFDLTERLLELARRRAEAEGLTIRFTTGDLLDVPYPDATFDLVVSTFGAFTADDPQRAAGELVRVCRPGGTVVTTAWGREGVFSVILDVVRHQHPEAIPLDAPDSARWAGPDGVVGLFGGHDVEVRVERVETWFAFPSLEALFATLERVSGPMARLRDAVTEAGGDWSAVRADVLERWRPLTRAAADGIEVLGVHGEAHVRRRS